MKQTLLRTNKAERLIERQILSSISSVTYRKIYATTSNFLNKQLLMHTLVQVEIYNHFKWYRIKMRLNIYNLQSFLLLCKNLSTYKHTLKPNFKHKYNRTSTSDYTFILSLSLSLSLSNSKMIFLFTLNFTDMINI